MNKKVNRKRDATLTIRLTQQEKDKWLKLCNREVLNGTLTQADVFKKLMLNKQLVCVDTNDLRSNTIALNRIGVNINQIAKAYHLGRDMDKDDIAMMKQLNHCLELNQKELDNIWQLLKR